MEVLEALLNMPEVHPAFANSGKKQGIEIWRIEDFEPVPVPQNQYGNFYSGDSYIVLKTTGNSTMSWDIHFWLGSKTSQDEAGAAAILSVNLDDEQFHGDAVQHRETQGYESRQFLGYFEPAIRYLEGGHSSGFNHVTINAGAEKRLFQIKGKRNVRVRQVEANVSSMNKGDCFILDVDHEILVYVGEGAKSVERLKAISVANQIRDQDHSGRGNIDIIDPYSHEGDVEKFFSALGSGSQDAVADAEDGGDDEDFEKGASKQVVLNEISDATGSMQIKKLSAPYTKEQLDSKECYILDTGASIYVWVGRKSNGMEKQAAMNKAKHYLEANNYPNWVEANVSSMNKGDCFILDVDHEILVYVGEGAKSVERLKAISVANQIRDQDHSGRGNIDIIDPYSHEGDVEKFFSALGSGSQDAVADAEDGGDDEDFEKGASKQVVLNEISDATGSMQIKKLSAPYTKEQLDSKECYILDTGASIYVWVGRKSNGMEKQAAMNKAKHYLEANNYPNWVHISKVSEGAEPTAFKQHFQDWN